MCLCCLLSLGCSPCVCGVRACASCSAILPCILLSASLISPCLRFFSRASSPSPCFSLHLFASRLRSARLVFFLFSSSSRACVLFLVRHFFLFPLVAPCPRVFLWSRRRRAFCVSFLVSRIGLADCKSPFPYRSSSGVWYWVGLEEGRCLLVVVFFDSLYRVSRCILVVSWSVCMFLCVSWSSALWCAVHRLVCVWCVFASGG